MKEVTDRTLVDRLCGTALVGGDFDIARVLAASARMTAFDGQEIIYEEGDVGDALYIVLSGQVRLTQGAEVIHRVEAGSVFGEFPVIDPDLRLTVTAIADSSEGVVIASVPRDAFLKAADDKPILWRRLCRILVERLMHKT